jgi:hypothetical protein
MKYLPSSSDSFPSFLLAHELEDCSADAKSLCKIKMWQSETRAAVA